MPAPAIEFAADSAVAAMQAYPARTQRATVRALNRALTTGHAALARLLAKDAGLKVGDAKKAIKVHKANSGHLQIRLGASLRRLPLSAFSARQTAKGVTVRDGRGRRLIPGAFIAKVRTRGPVEQGLFHRGHDGVFRRRGKKRLPIDQLFGPSLGRVFIAHEREGIEVMRAAFLKNLEHELKFAQTESPSA